MVVELQETLQMIWDSIRDQSSKLSRSFQSDQRLVLKLRVEILNILSDYIELPLCAIFLPCAFLYIRNGVQG